MSSYIRDLLSLSLILNNCVCYSVKKEYSHIRKLIMYFFVHAVLPYECFLIVFSHFSESRNYIIIGEEKAVTGAYGDILKLLLDEGSSSGIPYERKKQKRKELKAKPNEFVKHMAVDYEPEIPAYWKNFKPGATIQNALAFVKTRTKDYIRETLDSQDPIYKAIKKLIKHTWDGNKIGQGNDAKGLEQLNYTKMQVTKIQRVENLQLFDKYLHHRKHLFLSMFRKNKTRLAPVESLPGCTGRAQTEDLEKCGVFKDELHPEVNEHFFFHGTAEDAVDVICDTGLDCRLGSHQAMYGPGIYGAESSTKADQYTGTEVIHCPAELRLNHFLNNVYPDQMSHDK